MRAALLVLAISGLYASIATASPSAEPLGSSCSGKCDKTAAECVDACEAKFGDDASKRVGCKVECAKKRGDCEKSCGN